MWAENQVLVCYGRSMVSFASFMEIRIPGALGALGWSPHYIITKDLTTSGLMAIQIGE